MDRFMDKIGEAIAPIAQKMTANRYLSAIKEGFFGSTPILIAGSIFLLFTSLPFTGYSEFMEGVFGAGWMDFFYLPYQVSFKLMAIFVVIGMAKSLADYYKVDSKLAIALSFVGIFLITPVIVTADSVKGLPLDNFSAQGLFVCMIATAVSVGIVTYLAIWSGLVPMINGINLPYTIPAVISGFMICGWQVALLQAVLLIMTGLIYYPFFKAQDKQAYQEEQVKNKLYLSKESR